MEKKKIRFKKINPANKKESLMRGKEYEIGILEDSAMNSYLKGVTVWVIYQRNILDRFTPPDFTRTKMLEIFGYYTLLSQIANTFEEAVEKIKKLFPEEEFEFEVVQ